MDQSAFIRGLLDDQEDPQLAQYDPQGGWNTAKSAGSFLASLTTPGAIADAAGYLGGPSAAANIQSGNYGDAALQALGLIPGAGLLGKAVGGAKLAMAVPAAAKAESIIRPIDIALNKLGPKDLERALNKAREIIPNNHSTVMWHGSGSGDLRGGTSGLHLGTHEAARQALEARIGVPAEGNWYGTRRYGDTMLMGKDRIPQREDGYRYVSGYNVSAPSHDYIPTQMPNVSRDVQMDHDWTPSLLPYRITGEMKNTPQNPLDDFKANAVMQGLLKRGQARRGLYYGNVAEDAGSVSATVPGPSHVEPVDLEELLRTGKYGLAGLLGGGAAAYGAGNNQAQPAPIL